MAEDYSKSRDHSWAKTFLLTVDTLPPHNRTAELLEAVKRKAKRVISKDDDLALRDYAYCLHCWNNYTVTVYTYANPKDRGNAVRHVTSSHPELAPPEVCPFLAFTASALRYQWASYIQFNALDSFCAPSLLRSSC